MKIKPKVCMTLEQKIVPCSCSKTGINSALVVPAIRGYVFEYVHPLAYWSNVKGMVKQGSKYLAQLEDQILAGLFISTYKHFSLLETFDLTAQEVNAVLCTASKETLIEGLTLSAYFKAENTLGTPVLSLNWTDIKDLKDVNGEIASYVRRIRADFIQPEKSSAERHQDRITVLNKETLNRRMSGGIVALSTTKVHLADSEREFEVEFKAWKKEAKELVKALSAEGIASKALTKFLGAITADRNLITMESALRTVVCSKLQALQDAKADRFSAILLLCINPYDIFATVSDSLDKVSDSFSEEKIRPRTIAEILADKKRKSQVVAITEEQTEELFNAMNNADNPAAGEAKALDFMQCAKGQTNQQQDSNFEDLEDDEDSDDLVDHFESFNQPSTVRAEDF